MGGAVFLINFVCMVIYIHIPGRWVLIIEEEGINYRKKFALIMGGGH